MNNNKGLNYIELTKLLKYIEKNHSWKNMYHNHFKNQNTPPKSIRYIDFQMDTFLCNIYSITFSNINNCDEKKITFSIYEGYDLKTKIYTWLKQ